MSVPDALSCLRLVLQSLCGFFPPSGTLLDLSGPFLPVKEFYGTRYQSGLLFLNFMWGVFFTACVVFLFFCYEVPHWIFNKKHAYRYSFSPNANCPTCPCTDSALNILSGCQHTKMSNMIIKRQNMASGCAECPSPTKGTMRSQPNCLHWHRQRR